MHFPMLILSSLLGCHRVCLRQRCVEDDLWFPLNSLFFDKHPVKESCLTYEVPVLPSYRDQSIDLQQTPCQRKLLNLLSVSVALI